MIGTNHATLTQEKLSIERTAHRLSRSANFYSTRNCLISTTLRTLSMLAVAAVLGPMSSVAQAQGPSELCKDAIMSPGFTQCWGVNGGNDGTNEVLPLLATLGIGDWRLKAKSDAPVPDPFDERYVSGRFGDFGFTPALTSPFAISFKHGNFYQLFYFAGLTDIDKLTWDLRPVIGTTGRLGELSHASLWLNDLLEPNIVVPEPSTYAMMLAGLVGLGVAARRRRKV